MGIYDTYGGIQLKVGDVDMNYFDVGDTVPIEDGVYLTPEGIVVILDGKLVRTFEKAISKWGEPIDPEDILKVLELRPFDVAMKGFKEQ